MNRFLKYLVACAAVILVVGLIAGSVVKTVILGIFGEDAHGIYSGVRIALQLIVFVMVCLWINHKDGAKYDSIAALDFSAISNDAEKKKKAITTNKHFKGEIICFSVFTFVFVLITIPTALRYSGVLYAMGEFIIAAIMIIIYTLINYKLTFKTLEQIRLTRHRYE